MAVSAEGQPGLPAGIFIVDVADGSMRPLTSNPSSGYLDKEPEYSPDGERIVFVRDRRLVDAGDPRDLTALFVVNVDGTGLRRLTQWDLAVRTPSWSPDGSNIVFASGDLVPPRGGRRAQVFVIGADGSGLRQLTSSATAVAFWPSWSPDGTRIVFTRWTFAPGGQGFELYTMRPDGSDLVPYAPTTHQEANSADWGTHP
jgi:Tol biopolymer transport system component